MFKLVSWKEREGGREEGGGGSGGEEENQTLPSKGMCLCVRPKFIIVQSSVLDKLMIDIRSVGKEAPLFR